VSRRRRAWAITSGGFAIERLVASGAFPPARGDTTIVNDPGVDRGANLARTQGFTR
jgi:hypothetical protein